MGDALTAAGFAAAATGFGAAVGVALIEAGSVFSNTSMHMNFFKHLIQGDSRGLLIDATSSFIGNSSDIFSRAVSTDFQQMLLNCIFQPSSIIVSHAND